MREKEYFLKCPWAKTYRAIASRCNKNHKYGLRGIKNNLGMKELKELWFRDKAYLMEKPSIDRIDSSKDYTIDNCRYIEYSTNLKRKRTNRTNLGRGVSFSKMRRKYRVSFKCNYKQHHGGYFDKLEDAKNFSEKFWSELLDKQIATA